MQQILNPYIDYLQKEKNYSPLTVKAYCNDINEFLEFIECNHEKLSALKVNYSIIREWIVLLVDSKIATTSVNRKIASLKSFYLFLLKTKQIESSPLLKHKSLKTAKKIQIPFSEVELENVIAQNVFANTFEGTRNQLIIELFYTTGIRRAELINCKISNVDVSNHTIKVVGKRNKERILPLLHTTESLLSSYIQHRNQLENIVQSDLLILSKKANKVSESFVYRLINDYFSTVSEKVKKSPHVLRHTFATHLLNNGADLNSVKELLGHASLSSTQIYTHSSLSELQKVHKNAHPRNKK